MRNSFDLGHIFLTVSNFQHELKLKMLCCSETARENYCACFTCKKTHAYLLGLQTPINNERER